ncbi:hypothetical protein DFP72DRAFT_893306 [Ephemerocybe angulata]|uniref:Uncharacterized protein n=1 Tax=Ephemerocybe angulata TaxID=980116 RepID=A0A8H6I3A9_9AGAR|nr:hypothetical protein DFP72DRAFT_893306 [Tulosesus angulatus]
MSGSALQSAGAREEPTTTIDDKGFNPWTLITPCSPRTPPRCSRVPFEDQEWIEQVLAAHSSPCEESPEIIEQVFIPEEDVFGSNSDGGVVRQEESPDRARIFKFDEKVFGRDSDDDDLSDEEYESHDKSSMSKRALTFEEQIFGTDSDDEGDEE